MAESRIVGIGYGMALNDNGTVWIWGTGSPDTAYGLQPVIMPGVNHVVSTSRYLSPVVLNDNGTVCVLKNYPMFENTSYQLSPEEEPVIISGFSNITAISGGGNFNLLALRNDGTVWAVGSDRYGQLGIGGVYGQDNFLSLDAIQVEGLSDVKAISMGDGHALALKNDGTVWAWGKNDMGQLGDGTTTYTQTLPTLAAGEPIPVMVKGLNSVKSIAAGEGFSMALREDGTVWTWGENWHYELGDGMPRNVEVYRATPAQVPCLTNVTAIVASWEFALALRDDGTVWAWGDNQFGELGDGTTDSSNVPVQVKGLSGIVAIAPGYALDENGVIWAWGPDTLGQLGDGIKDPGLYSTTAKKVPFSEALSGSSVRPSWMVSPHTPVNENAPGANSNPIEYMAAVNDMIYAFSLNGLTAIDGNASAKWNLSISGAWTYKNAYSLIATTASNTMDVSSVRTVPVFGSEDGYLYLYAFANVSDCTYNPIDDMVYLEHPEKNVEKELIAVSPDGKVEWTRSFVNDIAARDASHVEAHGGRVYLYHGYNETVLDASGNLLFNLENIAEPVSVDEDGNMYAMPAVKQTLPAMSMAMDRGYFDYRKPSNVVEKYGQNGTKVWQKSLGENASISYFMPAVWNDRIGIPLYRNGMLYVPVDHGIIVLNKDGSVAWTKKFSDDYKIFNLMPIDSRGNIYLDYPGHPTLDNDTILVLNPDGIELCQFTTKQHIRYAYDGILYEDGNFPKDIIDDFSGKDGINRNSLENATIQAYDMELGEYIWNFTTPVGQYRTVTVNRSNVLTIIPDYGTEGYPANSIVFAHSLAEIFPAGNFTYIYYRTAAWDKPVVYNESEYTYYSAIYALDKSGKLVWQKPLDSFVTAAAANNSTIYYGTDNGKISVSIIEAAAGFVLIGSALLLMFGYVSRARSKIDKNENRNRIFRFIAERPGSTLYEITRGTGMNMGTIRYHMMILGINHRIVSFSDEGKFVRYFTNSNSYSKEDQLVISIMRRDSIGRILKHIEKRSEATNAELCSELGLPESTVSKYLGELARKGILTRSNEQSIRASYSIKKEYAASVLKAVKLLDSGTITLTGNDEETPADAFA
jgi:alpha-tubulin suppressor-like RCC1 family protein/predicted transcriptional regulator